MAPEIQRDARSAARQSHRYHAFLVVWAGQLVSLLGSNMTFFALGVWVFQGTRSVTQFAVLVFFMQLPGILLAPLAGAAVDRFDRRRVMMASDTGSALAILGALGLLVAGQLHPWHLYVLMAVHSASNAFQWSAWSAATTLLVPRKQLARANGMVQTAHSSTRVVSPFLAGFLVDRFDGFAEILAFDLVTFVVAFATLAAVRFPRPKPVAEPGAAGGFWHRAIIGWTYIRQRPGLVLLLVFFAGINLSTSFTQVLTVPLVLGFGSEAVLGMVVASGGLGMLLGGVAMSAWGGPRRCVVSILGFAFLTGLSLEVLGLRPSVVLVCAGLFLLNFMSPLANSLNQTVWQSKVPAALQGRVFAVRRMIAWSTLPLGYLAAGPLTDGVFEPLLVTGGPWAAALGPYLGTGPGRGTALLLMVMGALTMAGTLVFLALPRLRRLEEEIPDAVMAEDTSDSGYTRPVDGGF